MACQLNFALLSRARTRTTSHAMKAFEGATTPADHDPAVGAYLDICVVLSEADPRCHDVRRAIEDEADLRSEWIRGEKCGSGEHVSGAVRDLVREMSAVRINGSSGGLNGGDNKGVSDMYILIGLASAPLRQYEIRRSWAPTVESIRAMGLDRGDEDYVLSFKGSARRQQLVMALVQTVLQRVDAASVAVATSSSKLRSAVRARSLAAKDEPTRGDLHGHRHAGDFDLHARDPRRRDTVQSTLRHRPPRTGAHLTSPPTAAATAGTAAAIAAAIAAGEQIEHGRAQKEEDYLENAAAGDVHPEADSEADPEADPNHKQHTPEWVTVFPLHSTAALEALRGKFVLPLPPATADAVAAYFGPRMACYFTFLCDYTLWLIPVAAIGVVLEIWQHWHGVDNAVMVLSACLVRWVLATPFVRVCEGCCIAYVILLLPIVMRTSL